MLGSDSNLCTTRGPTYRWNVSLMKRCSVKSSMILQWGDVQAPRDGSALGQRRHHLPRDNRLVCLDLIDQGGQVASCAQRRRVGLVDDIAGHHAENGLGGAVEERHAVDHIGGDHTRRDRGEYVVHQILHLGDGRQVAPDAIEETRVLDRQRSLIGKRDEQIAIAIGEQAGLDAVVGVDHAGDAITRPQRHAQDAAQTVGDDALLSGEPRIGLGIRSDDGNAPRRNLIDDGAAHFERRAADRRTLHIASHSELQLAGALVAQHQEAALGPRQLDDMIHDLVKHIVEIEGRVDGLADLVQRAESFTLTGQCVDHLLELWQDALHFQKRLLRLQHIGAGGHLCESRSLTLQRSRQRFQH
jgi:hypothetical protein